MKAKALISLCGGTADLHSVLLYCCIIFGHFIVHNMKHRIELLEMLCLLITPGMLYNSQLISS